MECVERSAVHSMFSRRTVSVSGRVMSPLVRVATSLSSISAPVASVRTEGAGELKEEGVVEVITGPMFAGKTTELLRQCRERRWGRKRKVRGRWRFVFLFSS